MNRNPIERPHMALAASVMMLAVFGWVLGITSTAEAQSQNIGTEVRANGKIVRYFDKSTGRTIGGMGPIVRHYTFDHSAGVQAYAQDADTDGLGDWLVTKTGTQTTQILAPYQGNDGASGGTLACDTVAAAASREVSIYQGKVGSTVMSYFDLQSVEFVEFRVKFTFTDCSSSVCAWGLTTEKLAYTAVDASTSNVMFHIVASDTNTSGDTSLLAESDDGTTDVSNDTGLDIATATWYVTQFDLRDKTNIKVYVNGTEYTNTTTMTLAAATGAAAKVGLFMMNGAASDNTSAMKMEVSDIWVFSQ